MRKEGRGKADKDTSICLGGMVNVAKNRVDTRSYLTDGVRVGIGQWPSQEA